MNSRLARVAATTALLLGAGCVHPPRAPLLSAHYVVAAQQALQSGDVEQAEDILGQARERFPQDAAVRLWSGELASMRWEDEFALRDLMAARASEGRGGFTEAELEGKIGDLMFRMGRYRECVVHLSAGQVGPTGAARKAWAEIASSLPYLRNTPELDVAELPLVDSALPQLICSIGGEEHPFVLDTRATFTTLSNALAAELPVSPILPAGDGIDGTGRSFPTSIGVLQTFSLGGDEIGPLPVLVVADAALALRDNFAGSEMSPKALIGLDVLLRYRVTFDPGRRSVVFQNRRGLTENESVRCLWVEENLMVAVTIENRKLWFVIDTGASASSLSELGLRTLPGGERRALESFRRVYSPGGVQLSARLVQGLVLEVSDARFTGVDLHVVEREPSEVFPVHGVLGADLLMKCRTTLDSGRIRVESL